MDYNRLFETFEQLTILVIGDVMIDSYLWGKVDRISPEAPIPIVALKKRENRMGGAANVAMNLRALGACPVLCSVIGRDEKGGQFLDLLRQEKITDEGIVRSGKRATTTKFRIFGNSFQMLRVDEEVDAPLDKEEMESLLGVARQILSQRKIDGIIFQDYDKGVITPALIDEVVKLAGERGIPVAVDPKKRNFLAYRGVTLFKPNLKELREGLNLSAELSDIPGIARAARQLRDRLGCRYVLTTLSDRGVLLTRGPGEGEEDLLIPAHARMISDVSGAGDTVISVASLCLAKGLAPREVAAISNLAGGLVCEEVGVVPVDKNKLLAEVIKLL